MRDTLCNLTIVKILGLFIALNLLPIESYGQWEDMIYGAQEIVKRPKDLARVSTLKYTANYNDVASDTILVTENGTFGFLLKEREECIYNPIGNKICSVYDDKNELLYIQRDSVNPRGQIVNHSTSYKDDNMADLYDAHLTYQFSPQGNLLSLTETGRNRTTTSKSIKVSYYPDFIVEKLEYNMGMLGFMKVTSNRKNSKVTYKNEIIPSADFVAMVTDIGGDTSSMTQQFILDLDMIPTTKATVWTEYVSDSPTPRPSSIKTRDAEGRIIEQQIFEDGKLISHETCTYYENTNKILRLTDKLTGRFYQNIYYPNGQIKEENSPLGNSRYTLDDFGNWVRQFTYVDNELTEFTERKIIYNKN